MTQRTSKLNWQVWGLSRRAKCQGSTDGLQSIGRNNSILVLSYLPARNLAITSRIYTNSLELKHRLKKKRLREDEMSKEVANVASMLEKWTTEFYLEEERAVRDLGKYRLAPGYDQFQVDSVK